MEENTRVGKYRLVHRLAMGGMGEVFLARSEGPAGFSKKVVIKRILSHLVHDTAFVDMFLNEARLAALLSHPNIVQIFELGEEDGGYFIAMEYIHGRSLRGIKQKLLERKQLFSPMLAARVCSQALTGLHYAHHLTDDRGQPLHIVHRDVTPDNVLLSVNGQVKLVDFGIAKATTAITTTRTGTIKGKYAYMAPEQLTGVAVDGRTDVYSMGVVLYELLTGNRPFVASTEPALINTILTTRPAPPRERNPSLPQVVNDIILKALERDPQNRFGTAEEMAFALEEYILSTGQALTGSQIGSFVKELFGDEIHHDAGMATPRPATSPGSRASQVGTGPGSRPAAPAVMHMPTPAAGSVPVQPPTQILATPISQKAPKRPPEPTATAAPALPPEPETVGAADPSPARRVFVPFLVGFLVAGAAAGAYLAFAGDDGAAQAAQPQLSQAVPVVPPSAKPAATPPGPVPEPDKDVKVAVAVTPAQVKKEPAPAPARAPEPAPAPEPAKAQTAQRPKRTRPVPAAKPSRPDGPGKVALRVNPWAEVFHDGRSLGITPLPPVTVPAGRQTFTLKNSELGVTRRVTVMVPEGGQAVLKADLFE